MYESNALRTMTPEEVAEWEQALDALEAAQTYSLRNFKQFKGAADWSLDFTFDFCRQGKLLRNPFWVRPLTPNHNTLTLFGIILFRLSLRVVLSCTKANV
jgi:hypothetical protein